MPGIDAETWERHERLRFLLGVTTERLVHPGVPPAPTAAAGAAVDRPVPRHVSTAGSEPGIVGLEAVADPTSPLEWLDPDLLALELRVQPYRLSIGLHRLLEVPWLVAELQGASPDRTSDEAELAHREADLSLARARVRDHYAAGGGVVTGSGGVLAPGLAVLGEMRALVSAGLEPHAALGAATRDAAAAIGVSDSLGTLEPGKLADLVVLEGNPLAEIRNTELVARVVKRGVLFDPASLLEELKDDLTDRSTAPGLRLALGLGAMLVALAALAWAVRRNRASLPTSWRA